MLTGLMQWWPPDAVLIVEDLPLTATGKVDKKALPDRFGEYLIRDAAPAAAIMNGVNHAPERV